MVEVMQYLFSHYYQIELNARLTELGNKFADAKAEVKALQTADEGKRQDSYCMIMFNSMYIIYAE